MRYLSVLTGTAILTLALVPSAPALMIAMKTPAQRALTADVVVVGKVTAVEKEPVEAKPFPNSPQKLQYRVAVVQVESRLAGADNLTHLKVGFIPPPPPQPQPVPQPGIRPLPIRRPFMAPELKPGDQFLLFLNKHQDAGFYMIPGMSPPIPMKGENAKNEIEGIKKVLQVVADPEKALKAEKAEDRYFAAATLITKYRSYPEYAAGGVDQEPIDAGESKLILKALAEGDWTKFDRDAPSGMQAFNTLGLSPKDGFVRPRPVPVKPGQPAVNFNKLTQQAFVKWLDGPGKDYRIKKIVPKTK